MSEEKKHEQPEPQKQSEKDGWSGMIRDSLSSAHESWFDNVGGWVPGSELRPVADAGPVIEQMNQMIAAMLPPTAVPLPVQILQARRNAVAREQLMQEFGALTSADIGRVSGSRAANKAALAHRWKSDGRIFAVTHHATSYFPGFQFTEDGFPLPIIAPILKLLGDRLSPWELALWFTGANGWLGGARPVDLLTRNPDRVVEAARRESEALVF